jgi:predicted ABC-type sugar transport system permease subunit
MKFGASTEASPVVRTEFRHTSIRTKLERSGIVLLLVAMGAVFTWREPAFLSVDNLFSILQAASIVALLAVGVSITLAVGVSIYRSAAQPQRRRWPRAMCWLCGMATRLPLSRRVLR